MIPGQGDDTANGGAGMDFSGVESNGNDIWNGGPGRDHLTDFRGVDEINGGSGNDSCLATLDDQGGDEIHGGPGVDIWDADPSDEVHAVEQQVQCFAE
jgi:hypothetical protein